MTITKSLVLSVVLCVGALQQACLGVSGVRLSVQNPDVHLRWPSTPGQTFVIGYRSSLNPGSTWTLLETVYPAAAGTETAYAHHGIVVFPNPAGGGSGGGSGGPPPPSGATSFSTQESVILGPPTPWQLENRPPFPWDEGAIRTSSTKTGEYQSLSAFSADATTSEMAPEGSVGFYFVSEYSEDFDGDLLSNGFELSFSSSPITNDSDGDGNSDAEEDFHGDGFNNFDEYIWGTSPSQADNDYPLEPPAFGSAYSGEMNLAYIPDAAFDAIGEGPYLSADDFTA
jgi:hypothetical protein